MSQCPTASATPSTVLDSQPSGLLDATPYVSQIASTVWQSQELPLSQLTPRALKEGWIWTPKKKEYPASFPLVQALVSHASNREGSEGGGNSIVPSMAPLESRDSIVPAAPEGEEDIGVLPQEGRRFCRKGKCYLLTYACYVKGEDTVQASCHEVVKEFAPLSAYEYLKKETDAWEAQYGTLTEEFLLGQCPAGLKAKTNRNEDFAYAMEAEDAEGFFGCLKECQPCDMAMGCNNLKAFTGYFYKDKGTLPQGVCEPKALKKATVNLPPGIQEWVTSNILERDPESDCGKILVLWGPSETGKSALALTILWFSMQCWMIWIGPRFL
ncbi:hypothetical protein RHS01_09002 [Rhizoctonia solani]|uniref:Uncharacterized protein n=1 Tax=Rhizoctonia solani TaxID=456999 RepID=A0A8H7I569_9AGAM|nr:hypothetical protein RHS01_09002 [Rhizoctonia solani]